MRTALHARVRPAARSYMRVARRPRVRRELLRKLRTRGYALGRGRVHERLADGGEAGPALSAILTNATVTTLGLEY